MMLLKVCGMRDRKNIDQVAAHKPDFMGFIFYPKSKRFVGENFKAPELDGIAKVGVFVNEKPERVIELAKKNDLEFIQLHGDESVAEARKISKAGFQVIKVFGVQDLLPLDKMQEFEDVVDMFLFDTKTPEHGGSGKHFDWNILKDYPFYTPYLLSGGIEPEDVKRIMAMDLKGLIGIDVNSKVEIEPGLKDIEKVKQLKVQIG